MTFTTYFISKVWFSVLLVAVAAALWLYSKGVRHGS